MKTIPTIISSFKESIGSIKDRKEGNVQLRTEKDLSLKVVLFGSIALILLMAFIPMIPGDSIGSKLLLGVLVVIFGAFFVTVSSRIVGIIGSSNNPISGMTIATVMSTCLVFIGIGWSGKTYEPMVLGCWWNDMYCSRQCRRNIAGFKNRFSCWCYTTQSTDCFIYWRNCFFIGYWFHYKNFDKPTADMVAQGYTHAIGTDKFPGPQATLMATLIKGILSFNLDWQFVFVGVALAVVMELCGVNSLSFAVGAYLPLSTTLPIFCGGAIRGFVDWRKKTQR